MLVTGIIAEYNPFHNGHLYQLQKAKMILPDSFCICIMSGNFTQRGEVALLDKWQKAALAVASGADLVFELPFVFAVRSAQDFAYGGIELLNRLHIASHLCFGAENNDITLLEKIAAVSSNSTVQDHLHTYMKTGLSYAAALTKSLYTIYNIPEALLKQPNNILAIEYLKAIKNTRSALLPLPIQREAAHYNDEKIISALASARAIRKEIYADTPSLALLETVLPSPSAKVIVNIIQNKLPLPSIEYLSHALLIKLRSTSYEKLSHIFAINEGLEHSFITAALSSASIKELLSFIKTKRYPQSRIQRILLYILLCLTKDTIQKFDKSGPLYARVLAFNKNGCSLLHKLKKTSSIPIITKTSSFLNTHERAQTSITLLQEMLAYDTYATDLYSMCFAIPQKAARDFTTPPVYIK